jgi:transaldolase
MLKVPATKEGLPAIEQLISEVINVNITLMFSLSHYEAVSHAYIRGLEKCADPGKVSSVASFFVSRVDTSVDRALEEVGSPEALKLRGKTAVANSKVTYKRFKEIFHGEAFVSLKEKGASVQRPLWASTSTKNPAYSDILYVANLIGPDTVNTLPPATLEAFRDHGEAKSSIEGGIAEAEENIRQLAQLDVNLEEITENLQKEGVQKFIDSFDQLLTTLKEKRDKVLSES